jgi:hypothetical protein
VASYYIGRFDSERDFYRAADWASVFLYEAFALGDGAPSRLDSGKGRRWKHSAKMEPRRRVVTGAFLCFARMANQSTCWVSGASLRTFLGSLPPLYARKTALALAIYDRAGREIEKRHRD